MTARTSAPRTLPATVGALILLGALPSAGAPVWTQVFPTATPGTRFGHRMVYDSNRAVVVLFGGSVDSTTVVNETWEYAGTTWILGPAAPPLLYPRANHAMAFDSVRNVTVLQGGAEALFYDDTWEYDGAAWTQIAPATTVPPAGTGAAMAFDESRGLSIMFGSYQFNPRVYEWNGVDWSIVFPATRPGGRNNPGLAYDGARIILFGGNDATGSYYQDTWAYDGSWTQLTPGTPPLARASHAMAWDSGRGRIVLFGGDRGTFLNDTWEYLPATIEWRAGSAPPPALTGRFNLGMAYDAARGVTVQYGGENPYLDETWEYSCAPVTLQPATLPDGQIGAPYSQALTAAGAASPVTFAVTTGVLPPGLALSTGGVISGTPTAVGTYPFTVTATDAFLCQGSRSYTLVIDPCPAITLSPATLPPGRQLAPYSQAITASGGQAPYAFAVTAGTLPPGIALASGGLLSGAPTAPGTFAFTVTATDAYGCTGSRAYQLVVSASVDFLVGQGLGAPNPNEVRVFDGAGAATAVDFFAYTPDAWGVNVAAGGIDADAYDEILAGPGPGDQFGPQVRAFLRSGAPVAKVNFYAYGTLRFGVNVAGGTFDLDAFDEILTGAGPGEVFGPHVRGWNYDGVVLGALPRLSYYAYGSLRWGVNVGGGDVDGDGFVEMLTGPGPGTIFGPQVRGWNYDGATVASIGNINFYAFAVVAYGANVAGGSVDADAFAEIAAAPGPGPDSRFPSRFRGYDYDGGPVALLPGYDVVAFPTVYGGRVGLGDIDGDAVEELVAGAGRDPAANATVKSYRYTGAGLTQLPVTFLPFTTFHGVNATGAALGY